MWREQQMARSFMAVVLLVLAGRVPGQPQFPTETSAGQGSIIFVGRVTRVGAASVREVQASPRTLVVHVTAVVAKPKPVALKQGDELTVEVKEPSAFAEGDNATFYTEPWVFAKGLAVREVRHEMEAGRPRAKA